MFLPPNPTTSDITLLAASFDEVANAEVLGTNFFDPATDAEVLPLTTEGYPPADVKLAPVAGAILPPGNGDAMLVIGVAKPGMEEAHVADLRLTYEAGGVTYVTVLPWYLDLRAPDASP
jgi:hypothetical protein